MEKEIKKSLKLTDKADVIRSMDLQDPYPDTLTAAERISASEAFALFSVRSNIPREYFWGRQLPQEYTRSPEYRIKSLYFQLGKNLLEEKPVWAVLNPTLKDTKELVIVDGHKRTRYSALFGISDLPTEVIDLEHLAAAWNQNPEELSLELRKQTDLAQWHFMTIARAKGKLFPTPVPLPSELKAADLPEYFRNTHRPQEIIMEPNHLYVLHDRR